MSSAAYKCNALRLDEHLASIVKRKCPRLGRMYAYDESRVRLTMIFLTDTGRPALVIRRRTSRKMNLRFETRRNVIPVPGTCTPVLDSTYKSTLTMCYSTRSKLRLQCEYRYFSTSVPGTGLWIADCDPAFQDPHTTHNKTTTDHKTNRPHIYFTTTRNLLIFSFIMTESELHHHRRQQHYVPGRLTIIAISCFLVPYIVPVLIMTSGSTASILNDISLWLIHVLNLTLYIVE